MIKLTREITPYVWVHPDGDRDREGGWERDEAIVAPNSLRIVANQFSSLIRVEYLFFSMSLATRGKAILSPPSPTRKPKIKFSQGCSPPPVPSSRRANRPRGKPRDSRR